MIPSGNMGRRKRVEIISLPKNKVVHNLEQNKENGYPDPDKLHQGTRQRPQEHPERRNSASNQ
jgi:hypothetical protein